MAFDGSIAIGGHIGSMSRLEEGRMTHGYRRRCPNPTGVLTGLGSFSALTALAFPLALGKEGELNWRSRETKQLLAGELSSPSQMEKCFFSVLSLSHLFSDTFLPNIAAPQALAIPIQ